MSIWSDTPTNSIHPIMVIFRIDGPIGDLQGSIRLWTGVMIVSWIRISDRIADWSIRTGDSLQTINTASIINWIDFQPQNKFT
jgi:hypothetical protein